MSEASSRHQSLQTERHRVGELADTLRKADAVTSELLSDVIGEACWRFRCIPRSEYSRRIELLIQSGAWTDAVLALLELELPQWQICRITYDAGEWHCALSRQRELPDWLDQSIEASHTDLSLAILSAFVDVQRVSTLPAITSVPSVPRATIPLYAPMCCDNFCLEMTIWPATPA
jgi:hypothetical protein